VGSVSLRRTTGKIVALKIDQLCDCGPTIFLPKSSSDLLGKVIGVTDGDTITVVDDDHHLTKIRLEGIDAPEKTQEFGAAAKKGD